MPAGTPVPTAMPEPDRDTAPILSARGLTRRRGHAAGCDGIDIDLRPGEIVALLGARGAGKSGLVRLLGGLTRADAGTLHVAGGDGSRHPLPSGDPAAARRAGIGVVEQVPPLPLGLDALDAIALGEAPLWRPWRRRGALRAAIEALIRDTGLSVPLDVPLERLTADARQRVAILGALHRARHVLLLDEPEARLTPQAADLLFGALTRLAEGGLSVLFAARSARETAFADRIVVLRAGRKVADRPAAGVDMAEIAALVAAAPLPERAPAGRGGPVLRLDGVTVRPARGQSGLRDARLTVHAGEIVGIAGLPGQGQAALADALSGLRRPSAGLVRVGDDPVPATPAAMIAAGVGHLPADPLADGRAAGLDVAETLALDRLHATDISRRGLLRRKAMHAAAAEAIAAGALPVAGPDAPVDALDPGALREVLLRRLLSRSPRVMLAEHPFDGLDEAGAARVAAALLAARARGAGVLLVSGDIDDLLALTDRIVVLHRGRIVEAGPAAALDRRTLGLMMAGRAT